MGAVVEDEGASELYSAYLASGWASCSSSTCSRCSHWNLDLYFLEFPPGSPLLGVWVSH